VVLASGDKPGDSRLTNHSRFRDGKGQGTRYQLQACKKGPSQGRGIWTGSHRGPNTLGIVQVTRVSESHRRNTDKREGQRGTGVPINSIARIMGKCTDATGRKRIARDPGIGGGMKPPRRDFSRLGQVEEGKGVNPSGGRKMRQSKCQKRRYAIPDRQRGRKPGTRNRHSTWIR